ncbi:MAG: superoxide dismutase, partial [Gemmatimonadetes bacterium]|nr:superoxide dismutase [Gemmatimonadota bacterium]
MKNRKLMLLLTFCLLAAAAPLWAHCEIPCGVYGDDARFAAIEEDLTTIEKSMTQIAALAGQSDAQSANQLARWVANKEEHANRIQHVVTQYFMTQRLKEVEEGDEAMTAYTE